MKAKKFLSILLAVLMLMAAFTACGGKEDKNSSSAADSTKSSKTESSDPEASDAGEGPEEAAEITIMMDGDNTPNATNLVLDKLGEMTNTKINMIYTPTDDAATKRSTMAASDTLPDMFRVINVVTEAQEYADAGLIYNLAGLEDKAPNWFKNAGELLNWVPANKDGAIYYVPDGQLGYAYNLNIRTDWLNNLNMEMPTNLDELYDVYYAFTNNDPDGNGKKDTFGLATDSDPRSFDSIFGAYGIPANKNNIVLDDGTVSIYTKHPNYLEAIKYIRRLINDGLVEPDWLTIPPMDKFGKMWNGVAGAMEFQCVGPTNNWMPGRYTEEVTPTFGFAVIEGPDGSKGVSPQFANITGGWCIAARTENIDACLRVADFCCTDEGNDLLYLGVEDVMFKWIDRDNGEYEYLGEYTDGTKQRAEGGFCYSWLCPPAVNCEMRSFNAQTREGVDLAHENMITEGVVDCQDVLQTRSDYGSDMDSVISEMYVALLQAGSDDELQGIFDEYMKRWETEAHGAEWEKEITEWYNANK